MTMTEIPSIIPLEYRQSQFGKRLKAARLALSVSQSEICRALRILPARWYHWERGTALPNPLALIRLYEIYRIPPDWIWVGDASRLPQEIVYRTYFYYQTLKERSDK